jgi:hypothetical protein
VPNVCTQCGATSDDLEGWSKVVLQAADHDGTAPTFPWVALGDAGDYLFHAEACRVAWLERVGPPA